MSAPEPKVRVERRPDYAFDVICDVCGRIAGGYVHEGWATKRAERHRTERHAVTVAALQARWDARDDALRALITEWRERTVTVMPSTLTTADTERLTWAAAATELERAIGGQGC